MQQDKHNLSMWLLYKSKHAKVNGCSLIVDQEDHENLANYIIMLLAKIKDSDAVLSLVNRYVNLSFAQHLPEDLPHIPTWLLAAQAYALVSLQEPHNLAMLDEPQILADILAAGEIILDYVRQLAINTTLWQDVNTATNNEFNKIQNLWQLLQLQNNNNCYKGLSNIFNDLRIAPHKWLAQSSPTGQLEPFTPVNADISELFNEYILQHIPAEFIAAKEYGLGELQLDFSVDQSANTFYEVHMPYCNRMLPDYARDVLFKVNVYFKYYNNDQKYLLTTSWFSHDLGTAKQRVENYYNVKLHVRLKHERYHWISLDARWNQVEGYDNTPTCTKTINYDRLGTLYRDWLITALPVNNPIVLDRVKKNAKFMQQGAKLLEQQQCTMVNTQQIELLRVLLQNELSAIILQQRCALADLLQKDEALLAALAKIDAYDSVLAVFGRLLNVPFTVQKLNNKFVKFIHCMQQMQSIEVDLNEHFENLFAWQNLVINPEANYLQGDFYIKVQAALAQLRLLQTEFSIFRLRVF